MSSETVTERRETSETPAYIQFFKCLGIAVQNHSMDIVFRPKQILALESAYRGRNVFINFKTGYGKSAVFLLARDIVGGTRSIDNPICLIISPLNSLTFDLSTKLTANGFRTGVVGRTPDDCDSDPEEGESDFSLSHFEDDRVRSGEVDYVFAHPEAITSPVGRQLLETAAYRDRVVVLAIDEAHCIVTWGPSFRTEYKNLAVTNAFIPSAVKIAATATAPDSYKTAILRSLEMDEEAVDIHTTNPDRENIKYEVHLRSYGPDAVAYSELLSPFRDELAETGTAMPVTVIFMKHKMCGFSYRFFEVKVKDPELFAQFHSGMPDNENRGTLLAMKEGKCRIIFGTSSFGMGVDINNIRRVIHIGPPRTIEEYQQESGRAGRDGQNSVSKLYYNNNDIKLNRLDMRQEMRDLVQNSESECIRSTLLRFFGFKFRGRLDQHNCCSFCEKSCICHDCS